AAHSAARPEASGKTALFSRNDRPQSLKRTAFQTENAPGLQNRVFRNARLPATVFSADTAFLAERNRLRQYISSFFRVASFFSFSASRDFQVSLSVCRYFPGAKIQPCVA
ncbi:hypothetical protein, partial [uncultured Desulfovibrio sp.]|uniref:hypothetical protein n=1 Tax=uncultured Desulfovibrio sp. TaxID=167968 RepID=UPI0026195195